MLWSNPIARLPAPWRGKALARVAFLLVVSALVAALAAAFGIARDYGYLQATILTGSPGGQYNALGTRLAERARREHGSLTVIPTAGSIEKRARCQRQTNSFVTPMGDEIYYRYQQALIDEAATTLAALLRRGRHPRSVGLRGDAAG